MREGTIGEIQVPIQADLDRIADTVVRNLGVDIAILSMLKNRHLIALGLSSSVLRTRETTFHAPGDLVCFKTLETETALILPDARLDETAAGTQYVAGGLVVGYLGVPILNREVGAIGVVCGVTSTPRDWSERDIDYLWSVAQSIENLVMREMYRLESADASNLASEYDQIISAFSLVRAEPTSIHDATGRLVFSNAALTTHVSDDDLESDIVTEILKHEDDGISSVTTRAGHLFRVARIRTGSGYYVCQWSLEPTRLN